VVLAGYIVPNNVMTRPQTIQLFLPSDSPHSITITELSNKVVTAILLPCNQLDNAPSAAAMVGEIGKIRMDEH